MIERKLAGAGETEALGAELSNWLLEQPGATLYLCGPLGAGKTTLVRGLLRALGIEGPIRSPTYTLLEPYRIGERHLLHLDLYRLQSPEEVEQLGLRDFSPATNWWVIEWPERGQGFLPPAGVSISLALSKEGRLAVIKGLPANALRDAS